MPRNRRRILSKRCYHVCFRAKEGLPFVAYKVMDFLLGAILARAQRDNKLELCHDIWNGSHPHIVAVAYDNQKFVNFYKEVQKAVTEAMKRLLGYDHLSLWEGDPLVAELGDLEAAKDQIAYLYANPAKDNLVDSIDLFPGYSSWQDFLKCKAKYKGETEHVFPWVRLPSIPKLSSPVLSLKQDTGLVRLLKRTNKKHTHKLVRQPNAWMTCFGITTDEEAEKTNTEIIELIEKKEAEAREKRIAEGKNVMGVNALTSQPILKSHKPKKRGRKVYVIAKDPEIRMQRIAEHRAFSDKCRECFKAYLAGDVTVTWPPGAFKPPLPPNANIFP